MRPIDKGDSPYVSISEYSEALPFLEQRIGCCCSYCEMSINHVPEVEHVIAKSRGGDETAWSNLLLSCKYCNTRKSTVIGDNQKELWIWPDEHNTFLAFTYNHGKPEINNDYLNNLGNDICQRATKVYKDLKLDNIPKPGEKDRRYKSRQNSYNKATESLNGWLKAKGSALEKDFEKNICDLAFATGFFSVWMKVYNSEPIMLMAFIDKFTGTAKNCFDNNGQAIPRPDSQL
jgi:hypothetical protein